MGWNDYMDVNGECHFPTDLEYMEGWDDAKEALFEIEMEAQLELKAELYENEHNYFEV